MVRSRVAPRTIVDDRIAGSIRPPSVRVLSGFLCACNSLLVLRGFISVTGSWERAFCPTMTRTDSRGNAGDDDGDFASGPDVSCAFTCDMEAGPCGASRGRRLTC